MSHAKALGLCVCVLAALTLPAALAGETKVSTFEKRFPLNPGQPVSVSFRDSDGDVKFLPGESSEVFLKVWKETDVRDEERARSLMDKITVDVSQQANDIRIEIRYPPSWRSSLFSWGPPQVWVRSEVVLPRECRLECQTSDGDISASGLKGRLSLRTSDGNVSASGINDDLFLQTSDGDIRLADAEGRMEVRTSDGELELENVRGEIKAIASDGNIRLKGVLTALDLETSDGDISVEALPESRAASDWILRASDGDIDLALAPDFSADVRIHTGDGDIDCRLPLTLQGKTSEHDIQGVLGSGGRLIDVKTSDGDITLKPLFGSDRKPQASRD